MASRPPKYSKDTLATLDAMMKTSNLPLYEQRRLRAAAQAGPAAPMPPPRRRPQQQAQQRGPYEDLLKGVPINPRMQLPGAHRKSQQQIIRENGGTMERAQFRGGPPASNREEQKLRFQQKLQYGYELPPLPSDAVAPPQQQHEYAPPRPRREEDVLREKVVMEIAERQSFLDTMRAAGKGAEHEDAIKAQIAERMRDLKTLDDIAAR